MQPTALRIDNQRILYSVAGPRDAPALILLHGFLSYQGVWCDTLHALSPTYRCITVDLLGFGDSDKPSDGDYSIEAHARRVLELADTLGLTRFALLGHSLGAQIAFSIASRLAPERVTRLISVAGVVTGRLTPVVEFIAYPQITLGALQPGWYTLWRWLAQYPQTASMIFKPWFHRMDALPFGAWAKDRDMALQPGIHYSAQRTASAIRRTDLSADLPRIRVPVLILFGRQDQTVPVSDGHLAAAAIPQAELHLLNDCGHFPMYEQPVKYYRLLHAFLRTDRGDGHAE